MDPDSKAAEELKRRGNRRFTNGMLPMLSAPQPATPPPTPAPTP